MIHDLHPAAGVKHRLNSKLQLLMAVGAIASSYSQSALSHEEEAYGIYHVFPSCQPGTLKICIALIFRQVHTSRKRLQVRWQCNDKQ